MNNNLLKFIFFGSSEFSVIILEELLGQNYRPLTIVTTPDKPSGRKKILTATPVKILALKENIPILQPEKLDEDFLKTLDPRSAGLALAGTRSEAVGNDENEIDIFIVASYGKIIPKNILTLPRLGCLNIHPSLLPKYRGASPIQTALLNGDKETGVTIMLMDEKLDHGPILSSLACPIAETENFLELHNRLAIMGAELLIKILPDFLTNKIKMTEQNHAAATFSKIINKTDGEISWQKPAREIHNQWRAFHLWPGIFGELIIKNKKIKINFTVINLTKNINKNILPGEYEIINKKLYVASGDKYLLEIIKLQPAGKKEMTAAEFINGYLKI